MNKDIFDEVNSLCLLTKYTSCSSDNCVSDCINDKHYCRSFDVSAFNRDLLVNVPLILLERIMSFKIKDNPFYRLFFQKCFGEYNKYGFTYMPMPVKVRNFYTIQSEYKNGVNAGFLVDIETLNVWHFYYDNIAMFTPYKHYNEFEFEDAINWSNPHTVPSSVPNTM